MAAFLTPRRRIPIYRLTYIAAFFTFITLTYHHLYHRQAAHLASSPRKDASNSTLGFQKILVLSEGPSWRTRGLLAAAAYTDLTLTIPPQPPLAEELLSAFEKLGSKDVPHPQGRGETRNWLSFLDIIKHIIFLDLETSLILEDDVDWDVRVKHSASLLSDAVREFTGTKEEDGSPYGHAWDLLWIGHCAEPTENNTRKLLYDDPAAPHPDVYFGWSKKYMSGLLPGKRSIQRVIHTDCSYALGLSRRGAIKISTYAGKGEDLSFDTRIKHGCAKKELSCLVVNPELMHHYIPPTEFGRVSTVQGKNGRASRVEEEEFEGVMGNTPNILSSARCKALFDSTCPGPGQG